MPFLFVLMSFISQAPGGKIIYPPEKELIYYRDALGKLGTEETGDALILLENFVRHYPSSSFADNAIYAMALVYRQQGEKRLEEVELQRLLNLYPASERAGLVRQQLLALQSSKNPSSEP